jgi:hypothetical protein
VTAPISRNPADQADPPEVSSPDTRTSSPEQVRRVLKRTDEGRPLFRVGQPSDAPTVRAAYGSVGGHQVSPGEHPHGRRSFDPAIATEHSHEARPRRAFWSKDATSVSMTRSAKIKPRARHARP